MLLIFSNVLLIHSYLGLLASAPVKITVDSTRQYNGIVGVHAVYSLPNSVTFYTLVAPAAGDEVGQILSFSSLSYQSVALFLSIEFLSFSLSFPLPPLQSSVLCLPLPPSTHAVE